MSKFDRPTTPVLCEVEKIPTSCVGAVSGTVADPTRFHVVPSVDQYPVNVEPFFTSRTHDGWVVTVGAA